MIGIADYMHLIQVEQLSKGIPAILSIDRKQDRMLEKQDLQMEITKNGFNDMRKGFAEVKEEMKAGFTDVKEEINMQRDDFREVFMHEVSELRSEIAEVKAAMARMQAAGR